MSIHSSLCTDHDACDEQCVYPPLQRTTIDLRAIERSMRYAGRNELVHYAGAAHRDSVAWHVCREYLADPEATEPVLRARAVKAAWGWDVSPEQMGARS